MDLNDKQEIIYVNSENCTGCNKCILECPIDYANTSYFYNGERKIKIEPSRCLHCGHCIEICDHDARDYYDDTEAFFDDLKKGENISVIAAPSIKFHFENYKNLFGFLKTEGADVFYDVSFGADIATWSYFKITQQKKNASIISQPCPIIVNYIEKYRPELIHNLAPVQSPAVSTAIYMKKYKNIKGKIAFLSPCIGKIDEFNDVHTKNNINYNITYKKLLNYMEKNNIIINNFEECDFNSPESVMGFLFSRPGGLKENISYYSDNLWIRQVDGHENAYEYLDKFGEKVKKGQNLPDYIDILNCIQGCNLGSGTNKDIDDDEINYKVNLLKQEQVEKFKDKDINFLIKIFDKELSLSDFIRDYSDKSELIKEIFEPAKGDYEKRCHELYKITEDSRNINCFTCGYGSCQKFVTALHNNLDNKESCIDYTRQIEMEFLKEKEIAEKANRDKSKFLAHMSHEIRTPLNGVVGYIQLLLGTALNKEQEDFVNEIQKSSESLLYIINDILDFSKIEAGKLTMENIGFDLHSVVEDAVVLSIYPAKAKGLEMTVFIESDVPAKIYGDPTRLKQVLNNLISNAVKFTKKGDVSVKVRKISGDDKIAELEFEISDTGAGISKKDQEKIFDSFTQGDSSSTRHYGGAGLGLAISKKIVDLMNGTLTLKSKLNKGSTFLVGLKVEIDKNIDENLKQVAEKLMNTNVLLVDNNPACKEALNRYLREVGCNVFEADSSESALIMLELLQNINIVLTDCNMPETNYVEFASEIKEKTAIDDIPLVLLSSVMRPGDLAQAKKAGFANYLNKPVRKKELYKCILNTLNKDVDGLVKKENTRKKQLNQNNCYNKQYKILIVEDSEMNSKLLSKILSRAGSICDTAENGAVAAEAFQKNDYDLIIMDCQMPIMNGYESARQIRKIEKLRTEKIKRKTRHIPIVALTAHAMQEDADKCYNAGMDYYLTKPVDIDKLFNVINKYLPLIIPAGNRISEPGDDIDLKNKIISDILKFLPLSKEEATTFLEDYKLLLPEAVEEIKTAYAGHDFNALKLFAHKLKGISANLRVCEIQELCLNLENAAIQENIELCDRIIKEMERNIIAFKSKMT